LRELVQFLGIGGPQPVGIFTESLRVAESMAPKITAMRCTELTSKTGVETRFRALDAKLDFYWQFSWQSALFIRHNLFSFKQLEREARVGIGHRLDQLAVLYDAFQRRVNLNSHLLGCAETYFYLPFTGDFTGDVSRDSGQ
jgi:hypothetical protein